MIAITVMTGWVTGFRKTWKEVFFSARWVTGFQKTGTAPHLTYKGPKALTAGELVEGVMKNRFGPVPAKE